MKKIIRLKNCSFKDSINNGSKEALIPNSTVLNWGTKEKCWHYWCCPNSRQAEFCNYKYTGWSNFKLKPTNKFANTSETLKNNCELLDQMDGDIFLCYVLLKTCGK